MDTDANTREFLGLSGLSYCLMSDPFLVGVAKELAETRAQESDARVVEIYAHFTHRMHDLSELMKTLLRQFSRTFD